MILSRPGLRSAATLSLLVLFLLGTSPGALEGQSDTSRPTQMKAAFLYNFARFIDWPESGRVSVDICVLGDPASSVAVESIAGKIARGQTVRVAAHTSPRDVRECQIVFIASEWQARLPEVLGALEGTDVLTVGDSDGFAEDGGMIGLNLRRNRFLLEINVTAIRAAGLTVSSQLLALSNIIDGA